MLVRSAHEHLHPASLEVLEVIVSELASNAVQHAATPFTVRVMSGSPVRVEVADGSCAPPVLRQAVSLEAGGRGLVVVDALADRWGHEETAEGKVVWAELDRSS
jgi:anti-sigma regulatory factor (Ser/Thr protein kinase)